mmetsp:Transcript_48939/g.91737  ORF Transcript_48939/g.91737 Transcript_48939/m.91737 type:complete len:291 (-) Transcript_48939:194-1066(-)
MAPGHHASVCEDGGKRLPRSLDRLNPGSFEDTLHLVGQLAAAVLVTPRHKASILPNRSEGSDTASDLLDVHQLVLYFLTVATGSGVAPAHHTAVTAYGGKSRLRGCYGSNILQLVLDEAAVSPSHLVSPSDHATVIQHCGECKARAVDLRNAAQTVPSLVEVASSFVIAPSDHRAILQDRRKSPARGVDGLHILQVLEYSRAVAAKVFMTPSQDLSVAQQRSKGHVRCSDGPDFQLPDCCLHRLFQDATRLGAAPSDDITRGGECGKGLHCAPNADHILEVCCDLCAAAA